MISNLTISLQLAVLLHLNDDEVAKVIQLHGSVWRIEWAANHCDFQRFLMDLLTRIEKRGNKLLKNLKKDYKFKLERSSTYEGRRILYSRAHWPTQSIGLHHVDFKFGFFTPDQEKSIFIIKFGQFHIAQFPLSVLPDSVESFLTDVSDPDLLPHLKFPSKLPEKIESWDSSVEDLSTKNMYFSRIGNMFTKINEERYHEALVVCLELLESPLFKNVNFPYTAFVWGGLSVILSAYNLSDKCIQSCLSQVKKMVRFGPDEFDLAWFRQQVYFNQNKFVQEREMFELVFHSVLPKSSSFCCNSFKLHLESQLAQFDNWILEIQLMKKTLIVNRNRVRDQIDARRELASQDIARLKKLLHTVHTFEISSYAKTQRFFQVLELYRATLLNSKWNFNIYEILHPLKMIDCDLDYHGSEFSLLVSLLNPESDFGIQHYTTSMEEKKTRYESTSHQQSAKEWAENCFTHFVFLALSDTDDELVEWLRSEAAAFYNRIGHYRGLLLSDFQNCEQSGRLEFEKFKLAPDAEPVKDVRVRHLFGMEPKLKFFVQAGKRSTEIYKHPC